MSTSSKQDFLRPHYEVMNHYLSDCGFKLVIDQDSCGVDGKLFKDRKLIFESLACRNMQAVYEEITEFIVKKAFESL